MLLLLGCGAAAPVPVTPVTTNAPETDAGTDVCAGASSLVLEVPAAIPSQWSGALIVAGTATATIRWCGEGIVGVDRLELGMEHGAGAQWSFDPAATRLAHGESVGREIHGTAEPSDLPLTAVVVDEAGREIVAAATVRSVVDPAFTAARDDCLARGGTFAPAGMSQAFLCDAPTHDAGRRCLSSAECESACIEDHVEVTSTAPDGRTCAPNEELRLHVGTCSDHTLRFGCSALLEAVTTDCHVPGRLSGRHTVCVD